MSNKTEICNLAIAHLGVGAPIVNLDTEDSAEAEALRRFYSIVKDQILADFSWPFATKFANLALIAADPTEEWLYSYQYPSDCAFFRRIVGVVRIDDYTIRVPFRVIRGNAIYTDQENAVGEYTTKDVNESAFPPSLVMAMSLRLAIYLAPRVTAGDNGPLIQRLAQSYSIEMSRAQANAANEQGYDQPLDGELIRSRY